MNNLVRQVDVLIAVSGNAQRRFSLMDNVISIIPAIIRRDGCELNEKLTHLEVALATAEDLNDIRVHLIAQLSDICRDLGLPR